MSNHIPLGLATPDELCSYSYISLMLQNTSLHGQQPLYSVAAEDLVLVIVLHRTAISCLIDRFQVACLIIAEAFQKFGSVPN